jgi:hypothetical protein
MCDKCDSRLTELKTQEMLTEEECIERFALEFKCSWEAAEEFFRDFAAEYAPVKIH